MFIAHACHLSAKQEIFFATTGIGSTCATVMWHWPILTYLCACRTSSPNNLCLFCVTPGILLPLWVSCKSSGFFFFFFMLFFQPHYSCVLSPSLPWRCTSCIHQLVLIPECPVPSFPLLCCSNSRMLMLNWPYKMIHYLTPLLSPSSVFNFSARSVCWLWAASTLRRRNVSRLTLETAVQTAAKGSNSTGCHSGVAHLCRNTCSEQNNACTNSYLFSKDECRSFLETYIILQKFCYPVEQVLRSHSWLVQPRQPVCPVLPSPLCWVQQAAAWMFTHIST